ncbi:MAG: gamma-glutamylcyclotransferase, partial [Paracoccaceae bacterium]
MPALFFYGTLCHRPLLDCVLGPERGAARVRAARLPGHAVHWVAGESFPMIRTRPGASAEGLLVSGLTPEGVARLDFYEGGFGYTLREVEVETGQGDEMARVYFPDTPPEAGAPWSLADWVARWGELTLLAAEEVMESYGRLTPEEIARRFPSIRARAASRLNARHSAPTTLRRQAGPGDVTVREKHRPYNGFFAVEDYALSHVRFDGSTSPVLHRAAFISTDAVTVLPYDPDRDRVMVVEQFRMGPFARGDAQCWSLEAIA